MLALSDKTKRKRKSTCVTKLLLQLVAFLAFKFTKSLNSTQKLKSYRKQN